MKYNHSITKIFALAASLCISSFTAQAADEEGWVVSITPSGGWIPAVIAGKTGVGLSQRAQSFVLDPAENPYNVIEPGKRPRATLTPSMALKMESHMFHLQFREVTARTRTRSSFFSTWLNLG